MKPLESDNRWSIGSNFVVKLPPQSSTVDLYPWFWSGAGQYGIIGSLFSPQLNNTRDIIIYTPPSYYENTLKTINNVLIMHDGQNIFNASTSFAGVAWNCQDTINSLVVQGLMEEVLIIGVYNTPNRLNEYTYIYDPCYSKNILGNCEGGGGEGDLYLDFLIENVVPFVKQAGFRIVTERENLGILGSSLGGLISCYAGLFLFPFVFFFPPGVFEMWRARVCSGFLNYLILWKAKFHGISKRMDERICVLQERLHVFQFLVGY